MDERCCSASHRNLRDHQYDGTTMHAASAIFYSTMIDPIRFATRHRTARLRPPRFTWHHLIKVASLAEAMQQLSDLCAARISAHGRNCLRTNMVYLSLTVGRKALVLLFISTS